MKIIYLNLNYGRNDFNGILNFIYQNLDTDIFCFQEIKDEIKQKIDLNLKDFENSFISKELSDLGSFNLATYINKKYQNYQFEILEENIKQTAPAVYLEIDSGNSKYHILNFHGTYLPANKLDTEIRLEASQKLIQFLKSKDGIKIIGGDFNLLPETESIKLFEQNGYRNLIKDFNIQTTRNENAWKLYPENKQLFADYIFINEADKILNFKTVDNLISDHLPLSLDLL